MRFRSNASHRFDVHSPVDNPVFSVQVSSGVEPGFPRAVHRPDEADLLWLTGSESPIERQTLLDELNAERHGMPGKAAR